MPPDARARTAADEPRENSNTGNASGHSEKSAIVKPVVVNTVSDLERRVAQRFGQRVVRAGDEQEHASSRRSTTRRAARTRASACRGRSAASCIVRHAMKCSLKLMPPISVNIGDDDLDRHAVEECDAGVVRGVAGRRNRRKAVGYRIEQDSCPRARSSQRKRRSTRYRRRTSCARYARAAA